MAKEVTGRAHGLFRSAPWPSLKAGEANGPSQQVLAPN